VLQQQQSSGGADAFQPPDIAEALTSTAATAARQAENVPSNSVQQQHMTGCCPRNSRQLNLGRVQPISADIAGGQIVDFRSCFYFFLLYVLIFPK
jgi:hypothetical protein